MKKTPLLLFVAAVLLSSGSTRAWACTPLPVRYLNPVVGDDAKLPLIRPSTLPPTTGGMCPTVVWPFTFAALTDAQIAVYLGDGGGQLEPAWVDAQIYHAGEKASFDGKNYRARWWTQHERPAIAAVWERIGEGTPVTWSYDVEYVAGSVVNHQGTLYQAKWWTRGEQPGTMWSAWLPIGPAPVTSGGDPKQRPAHYSLSASHGSDANGAPQMHVTWATAVFTSATNARADNWRVNINGTLYAQGTLMTTYATECFNQPNCTTYYQQLGTFVVPHTSSNVADNVTFWLCAGSVCRPTPRLTWWQHTQDAPRP